MTPVERSMSKLHASIGAAVAGKYSSKSPVDQKAMVAEIMNTIDDLVYVIKEEFEERIGAGISYKRPWR